MTDGEAEGVGLGEALCAPVGDGLGASSEPPNAARRDGLVAVASSGRYKWHAALELAELLGYTVTEKTQGGFCAWTK